MDTGLVINIVIIAMLGATIFYAFRLERRLASMRTAQASLADVIRELNGSTMRAEAGIHGLKSAAISSGQMLDDKIKRARALNDELALLLESGERLGQRLESARPQVAPRTPARVGGEALRALGGLR